MAKQIVGVRPGGKFRSGVYFVQYPDGTLSTKDELRDHVSGKNAIPVHSHIHFDLDPVEASGEEVGPGDPGLQGFYVDSFQRGSCPGDLNQTGDESDRGEGNDHGCTPVFKATGEGTVVIESYAVVNGQKAGESITLVTLRVA